MKLSLDHASIVRCRNAAQLITAPITVFIAGHSTTSIERAVVRLCGVTGAYSGDIPLASAFVERIAPDLLERGAALTLGAAIAASGAEPTNAARRFIEDRGFAASAAAVDPDLARAVIETIALRALEQIDAARHERETRMQRLPIGPAPLLYVIVASGNIYEDRTAAVAAAEAGAQIIAVIRSTGQSLLDYVPEGATTEGFGGTYATQENFRIMRAALDDITERLGRYVMLTNYASGLCMPEIAAIAAVERLDMLLNDSMYGILFRDINMQRTFIDQHFSRRLNARAGIIINTGEDNYLTTADAIEQAPAVLASHFINESFARNACLEPWQIGLGDAFEIDPKVEDALSLQIAQALLTRAVFPEAPLKYMPPTKHMTGDIFAGQLLDAMFNLTSVLTGQTIHLCGMMTEAIHTPFVADRALALENAKYVFRTARSLGDELDIKPGGKIAQRAMFVVQEAEGILQDVAGMGLMSAIENAKFADVRRRREGGRGLNGVFARATGYYNPFDEHLA